jgi:hypothetical protein
MPVGNRKQGPRWSTSSAPPAPRPAAAPQSAPRPSAPEYSASEKLGSHPALVIGCLTDLVGELSLKSDDLRRLWGRQEIHEKTIGHNHFNNPFVGPIALEYESLTISGSAGQTLSICRAEPGSADQLALTLLAAMAAREPEIDDVGVEGVGKPADRGRGSRDGGAWSGQTSRGLITPSAVAARCSFEMKQRQST